MPVSAKVKLIKKTFSAVVISSCLVFLSCGITEKIHDYFTKKPEVEAISEVLKISMPIGYAAQIAMAAVNGERVADGITVIGGISGNEGAALVTIPVTSLHPLPVGSRTGTIVVSGFWLSKDNAVMAMAFIDFDIITAKVKFNNIWGFPVTRDSSGVKALFAKEWVSFGSSPLDTKSISKAQAESRKAWADSFPKIDSSVSFEQDAWMINVRNNGTPGDPSDDEYGLIGVGQYGGVDYNADKAYLIQLIMLGAAMKATCHSNPVVDNVFEGGALLNTYEFKTGLNSSSLPKIGRAFFMYHDKCDGKIDLKFATGCYIGRIGDSFSLNLD